MTKERKSNGRILDVVPVDFQGAGAVPVVSGDGFDDKKAVKAHIGHFIILVWYIILM